MDITMSGKMVVNASKKVLNSILYAFYEDADVDDVIECNADFSEVQGELYGEDISIKKNLLVIPFEESYSIYDSEMALALVIRLLNCFPSIRKVTYNLKMMGISVYSRYVLQNHASMEDFFQDLLTREDIIDISAYRKRFVYVQKFSQTLLTLKRNLQIVEFEPNQIISFAKLEQSGVSHEMIRDFCDAVYDYVEEGEYFSAKGNY